MFDGEHVSSPDEEIIKAAPGSHNELNDDTIQMNDDEELTEEQLLRYLDGDDDLDGVEDECVDGTHPDFVRNLKDKLLPLAEGYADPTPSCILGDLDITDSSTADNSSNNKENLSIAMTKSTKTTGSSLKTKQVYQLGKVNQNNDNFSNLIGNGVASASITSSKARMPAWMQASQEEEDDLAMNEDDEFLELERQAAKMAEEEEFRRNDVFNTGFAAPESIGKLRKNIPNSFAGASSKGSKKVPAWMCAGNEEDDNLGFKDDNLDNTLQLNDTQLAVAEMSSKGSGRQESTPSWRRNINGNGMTSSIEDDDIYSKKSTKSKTNRSNSIYEKGSNHEKNSNYDQRSNHDQRSNQDSESSKWTHNRSYHLRMNKMKENTPNQRNWAKPSGDSRDKKTPMRNNRDAAIRAVTDELDETKMLVRKQDNDILDLQEQINKLEDDKIQEECDRVEAEIAGEKAFNENRKLAQAKRELENQLADLEKQLNLEREKMLENVKVEHMKRIATETQLSELKQEMEVTKESSVSIENSPVNVGREVAEINTSARIVETSDISIQTEPVEASAESLTTNGTSSTLDLLNSEKFNQTPTKPQKHIYKSATAADELSTVTFDRRFEPSQSDIEESTSLHSGDEIDYDDRADDEQTVVTFRTGRGGRPRKPKIPNDVLSEESNNYENINRESKSNIKNSKQLKSNTWGSWALRTLSNNSHIIQNYLIRPALMAGAFNDPSHLVNRGSMFNFQRMITSSSSVARGSIKRSNTAEGMYNPFNVTNNDSTSTSKTKLKMKRRPKNK